tara:strand:- start:115 stop:582 length:468 start_codon:yes stop_codon:yes gene_type:complete
MDPLSAFAAIKTAHSTITQAIKIGKDLSQLGGHVTRWANAEANIENYASKRGSLVGKVFGKLSVTEQSAIEAHLRKEEVKRMRDEMREIFLLYGSAGQWERLQAEIAEHRARKKAELKEIDRIQKRNRDIIIVVLVLLVSGVGGFYYFKYILGIE